MIKKNRSGYIDILQQLAIHSLTVLLSIPNVSADSPSRRAICARTYTKDLESYAASISGSPNAISQQLRKTPQSNSPPARRVRKWDAPPNLRIMEFYGISYNRESRAQGSKEFQQSIKRELEEIFSGAISTSVELRFNPDRAENYMIIVSYVSENLARGMVENWDNEEIIDHSTLHQVCRVRLRFTKNGAIVSADNFIYEMTEQEYAMQIAENPTAVLNFSKLNDKDKRSLISQVRKNGEMKCAYSGITSSVGIRQISPHDDPDKAICSAVLLYQHGGKSIDKNSTYEDVLSVLKEQYRSE